MPRPESSGSSEVSGLQSDQGLNFVREDDAGHYNYSSFSQNYIPPVEETDRCVPSFIAPENGCTDLNRLTSGRSPTNERMMSWYQDRADHFSMPQTSIAPTNYPTVDPSYPIPINPSVVESFRGVSTCENKLDYTGYTYTQPSASPSYFPTYHHRNYPPYNDYAKF